jgi:hypothetical protein
MGCDATPRQCLAWHIKPKLAGAKLSTNGATIRARCPICDSHDGLTVSAGTHLRVVWNCYACTPDPDTLRDALTCAGVPPPCLPLIKRDRDTLQAITAACQQATRGDRAHAFLRVYLLSLGYTHWPRGTELVKRAGEIEVDKSVAYAARSAGPLLASPRTPSTYNRSGGAGK